MSDHGSTLVSVVVDGWTAVGVFVVVSVAAAGVVSRTVSRETLAAATSRRGVGPVVGALVGLVPGCGGAVAVATLYGRSAVGLGTVVAALAATAGDAVFVLLAVAPGAALAVSVIAFPTAIVTGVTVDALAPGIDRVERALSRRDPVADGGAEPERGGDDSRERVVADDGCVVADDQECVVTDSRQCAVDHQCYVPDGPDGAESPVVAALLAVWYLAVGVGLVAGVAGLVGVSGVVPEPVVVSVAVIGVGGAVAATLAPDTVAVGGRWRPLARTARTASPTVVWAVGGLAIVGLLPGVTRHAVGAVAGDGALAPVAGGLFGLLPGCGPHVAFAAAYGEGAVSFSALVAVTVAQDGDAIFPLVAVDRVAAVLATVYTTVPAIVAGAAVHALGAVCGVPVSGSVG